MSAKQIVVIGNGMVGQRFVEALQDRDADGSWTVTVLCEESRPAYDRVALSTYFEGTTAEELALVPAGCYDKAGYAIHLAETATSIDREARVVLTDQGRHLSYDVL